MPLRTLEAHGHFRVEFEPIPRGKRVRVSVESLLPTYAYIVNEQGMAEFDDEDEKSFSTMATSTSANSHTLSAFITRHTTWFLLVVNRRARATTVHWDAEYGRG